MPYIDMVNAAFVLQAESRVSVFQIIEYSFTLSRIQNIITYVLVDMYITYFDKLWL